MQESQPNFFSASHTTPSVIKKSQRESPVEIPAAMGLHLLLGCILLSVLNTAAHSTPITESTSHVEQAPCFSVNKANACLSTKPKAHNMVPRNSMFPLSCQVLGLFHQCICENHFCCVPRKDTPKPSSTNVQHPPKYIPCPMAKSDRGMDGQPNDYCIPHVHIGFVSWCAWANGIIARGLFRNAHGKEPLCGLYCTTRPPVNLLP